MLLRPYEGTVTKVCHFDSLLVIIGHISLLMKQVDCGPVVKIAAMVIKQKLLNKSGKTLSSASLHYWTLFSGKGTLFNYFSYTLTYNLSKSIS